MLTVENITKSYGDKVLFRSISCTISGRERIGLIGVNGTGKSSFLKAIAGIEKPEEGSIHHPKDFRIEYLAQDAALDPALRVIEQIYYGDSDIMRAMRNYEEALLNIQTDGDNPAALEQLMRMQQEMDVLDAWDANTAAKTVLTKLGITQFNQYIHELSGGQKKRVAIAKALIQPADLLILDEPTNHLDNETVGWLEKYLVSYKGALLLVTHDRYFLNRVTNRIYELDQGELFTYEGNYELFLEKKAEREALEVSSQQKHANTLRQELAWLKRGARARSTKQKARIERIQDMQERTFHTKQEQAAFQTGSKRLGKDVIQLESISMSFGEKELIRDFSELIIPGDRIGIIGPNGSGKTTLLNIMAGRTTPDQGERKVGETVQIGYYTQGEAELDGELRIIDYIKETAEVIHTADGDVITAEQMLERFLFSRAQQWTYIRRLSGGEKRRLYLLKVLMTAPNVLFLDEPTNDLDTQTLGILEAYLLHFPGVVITVSHDRYFLDRIAERLLIFNGSGTIGRYLGSYSEYIEQQEHAVEPVHTMKEKRSAMEQPKQKKKLSYQEKREWESIEDEIMLLEEQVEQLQVAIANAGSDAEKVQQLYAEQQQVEEQLEAKMERWEELSLLVESLENS
ncbi:ABC-F family ATP-binding cassette domain-containing protein [Ornithinibacillus gellani]|uniref:ABC-F family ATP-binding cassette domain-containing protein n=1 Tax=Ornithinibacillus gellani TaxID=2293253 RepID=UPI000F46D972|nr:ABC-F family ATP-binding cassette domain-containing protein [Ornithinibacillus gellani]TQS70594.1 ABC-F family ATP-binding cassette domain-containing protein [Ornithinibacillus gellani]